MASLGIAARSPPGHLLLPAATCHCYTTSHVPDALMAPMSAFDTYNERTGGGSCTDSQCRYGEDGLGVYTTVGRSHTFFTLWSNYLEDALLVARTRALVFSISMSCPRA
ncbi:hypothetical protein K525DRAFT_256738 [Schizophyllum commune Loenen D]|nr:hypothetical protein K525DRAFT_256738 [Schizophyllum commune Loenen D]